MKSGSKNKFITVAIISTVLILMAISSFAVYRIISLRSEKPAPEPSIQPEQYVEEPTPLGTPEPVLSCNALVFNLTTPTPTSTATASGTPSPSPTPTPSPSPTPSSCNYSCDANADCQSGLICSSGMCRNSSCTTQTDCICDTPTPTPAPISCNNTCTENSDCESGLICSSGACRNPNCVARTNCVCTTPTPTPITYATQPPTEPTLPNAGVSTPTILGIGAGLILLIISLGLAI